MTSTLVKDNEKYEGKYVATESFKNEMTISLGRDSMEVFREAKEKGIDEPAISFDSKKEKAQVC